MHHDGLTKELQAGFHAVEKPSPAAKNGFVSHISGAAVQHGDKWGGFQDDYESPVNGIASTVAHDMSLLHPMCQQSMPVRTAVPTAFLRTIRRPLSGRKIATVSATPGDDDGGDSAAVDHSSGMVAGKLTWSATPVTTARISDDVRPLFADGLGSKPSER